MCEWTPNMLLNDLALVKVKIPKHTETHLITLPAKGNIRKRIGTIHGWEKNKNKNNDSSLILRKYDVTIIENKICEEHFGSLIQKNKSLYKK
ncbi:hypothetical protein NQ314_007079 [Rhamnusium bicolor]|uniref:Peptidase S1 domain-containing protein n=1 Tax=Rhamnusium bicolor TaxID=1586634 RepID=A0AAV8YSS9_9CUCU|nr:hypothetical protein NQ314_007079 [Rhamnusium bicolor]